MKSTGRYGKDPYIKDYISFEDKNAELHNNFPNPFNPVTHIMHDLPNDEFITLKIYDVLGKEVALLVNEFMKKGSYTTAFDGSMMASGICYYRIRAGKFNQTKRMILLK